MAAALGVLDVLVFAGGIGENPAEVRGPICDGLGFLGVRLDPATNASNDPLISAGGSMVVWVIPPDEELQIARSVFAVPASSPATASEPTPHG